MAMIYDTNSNNATDSLNSALNNAAGSSKQYGGKNKNITRVRTGTDRNGNPIWKYNITVPKPSGTKPNTTNGKRGGGGSGGGSGGGGRKGVGGVEYFKPSKFSTGGLRAGANKQVNAQIAEKLRQNNVARGRTTADYKNAIAELQRVRDTNLMANTKSGAEDQGRLNNMSLNRDMGYGVGAGTNESSLLNKYAEQATGIGSQYADAAGQQGYDYNRELGNYTEADRVTQNSRAAEVDALYRQMYGEAWDRYLARQNLGMGATQQRNSARAMAQGK